MTEPTDQATSTHGREGAGLWRLLAAGLAVCCGIPLLVATGAAAGLAGIGLGSWLLVVVGLSALAIALFRWARQAQTLDSDANGDTC